MRVGIMQPYFLPYIGYWQLMNAVDRYVIYDDVNFIKGGWINRNRILMNDRPQYFNVPMSGASSFKLIKEIEVNNDSRLIEKNLRVLEGAYKKAPYYKEVYPLMQRILFCGKRNLAEYIEESLYVIGDYLDIKTEFIISSSLKKDCSLKGQDRVIAICKLLGAKEYYNAIGGQKLYSAMEFRKQGIRLCFLKTNAIRYEQFCNEFQENLSIVDVMMFNSKDEIQKMLKKFEIISENE